MFQLFQIMDGLNIKKRSIELPGDMRLHFLCNELEVSDAVFAKLLTCALVKVELPTR
jgi:hypothetical protein